MTSRMLAEARTTPKILSDHLEDYVRFATDTCCDVGFGAPNRLVTVGRGSSAAAGNYIGYLSTARYGISSHRLRLSHVSLFNAELNMSGDLVVAVSQSGASPDLINAVNHARRHGARTLAIVNDVEAPLAQSCDSVLPMLAGPEESVAATKSFMASLFAGLTVCAVWKSDGALVASLRQTPPLLTQALEVDTAAFVESFRDAHRLYVIGRGYGEAVSAEVALKLKETCGIQAESYSSAEVRHGPMTLIGAGYPVLVLAPFGPGQDELFRFAGEMRARGARVVVVANSPDATVRVHDGAVAEIAPIVQMQALYECIGRLASARGYDSDRPQYLSKVTLTH